MPPEMDTEKIVEIRRLPGRIVRVMIGTILVFVLTLCATVLWLTKALDDQAHRNSLAQVQVAIDNLLDQAVSMNLDYAKWDEAVANVSRGDSQWLFDGIGVAASIGEALQLVVAWGGAYKEDIGWTDDGVTRPRSGLLAPEVIQQVEVLLDEVPVGAYAGVRPFFFWNGGDLYALAASRMEKGLDTSGPSQPDSEVTRLAQGHRIDLEKVGIIGESTLLAGLEVGVDAPEGRDSLPLYGAEGEPVAFISWTPPQPGTTLLYTMLPVLFGIIALAALVVLRGLALVRRNAQFLVRAEKEASSAARTDALTGLPNRSAFNEALSLPAVAGGRAVLFLDINDFKRINDSVGHAAGDEVIIAVSKRLAALSGPNCFLARIAGDEFVFVVTGPDAEAHVAPLAEKAEAAMRSALDIHGHHMQVDLAIGYAIQSDDTTTGADLVRQADLAMYEAKRHKGSGPVAFNELIAQAARDALAIEKGLRHALAHPGEISVAYQPIIKANGTIARAEALARWTSPDLGTVRPDRFIAVAEQAGLIVELGRRLITLICADLASYPELKVSINISPLELMAPDFIPRFVRELQEHAIDPSRIEIEITESVVVDDPRLASERLEELRAAGFSIALDDFGTGYSSVGYIGQFKFDTLKIDRSFVSKIRSSNNGITVVDGMIRIAHGFELQVVCEGIESNDDYQTLCQLGCDLGQGFYIGRPMPVYDLAERWYNSDSAAVTAVA